MLVEYLDFIQTLLFSPNPLNFHIFPTIFSKSLIFFTAAAKVLPTSLHRLVNLSNSWAIFK